MIFITLLIGFVAIIGIFVANSYMRRITDVEIPKLSNSEELEINVKEVAKDVLDYLLIHSPLEKSSFNSNSTEFKYYLKELSPKLEAADSVKALDEINSDFDEFHSIGKTLIDIKDKQSDIVKKRRDLLNNDIEVMLDDTLPHLIKADSDYNEKLIVLNELEINIHELMSAVRGYILKPDHFLKDRILDSIKDMNLWQGELSSFKLSKIEKLNVEALNQMVVKLIRILLIKI
jgi:hypothetical protein